MVCMIQMDLFIYLNVCKYMLFYKLILKIDQKLY